MEAHITTIRAMQKAYFSHVQLNVLEPIIIDPTTQWGEQNFGLFEVHTFEVQGQEIKVATYFPRTEGEKVEDRRERKPSRVTESQQVVAVFFCQNRRLGFQRKRAHLVGTACVEGELKIIAVGQFDYPAGKRKGAK